MNKKFKITEDKIKGVNDILLKINLHKANQGDEQYDKTNCVEYL